MQLSYVKHLAESHTDGEKVRDVIVTVPPFYTQFERDAMVDAIEIAGLKTLALINDGTAVAVNYAMTRTFAKPEIHVIYDAGASSIRATVVQFSTGSLDGNGKKGSAGSSGVEGPQVTVMGVGYDRWTGGIELDRRMREILIESFNAKHGRDVRKDAKGMAKLWKEAGRVKAVLSANSDAVAQVSNYMPSGLCWCSDVFGLGREYRLGFRFEDQGDEGNVREVMRGYDGAICDANS